MKATEDILIVLNKEQNVRVPYKDGDSKKGLDISVIKKGQEIPDRYARQFAEKNLEYLDIKYKNKSPIFPEGFQVIEPPVSKKLKIKNRKFSQNSLTKIANEKGGLEKLKKIGKELGEKLGVKKPEMTDRSRSKLVVELLKLQEQLQRKGL